MNVLVACEESQRVCVSFRLLGHNAFSCDLSPCSGGHPEWHIQGDCLPLLNGDCFFETSDGNMFFIPGKWDLIIAHPPCTYMCQASACRMYPHSGVIDTDRLQKGLAAKDFFLQILNCNCDRICIENPRPLKVIGLPPASQIIQPYMFGDAFSKRTLLWLKGLPPLVPGDYVSDYIPYISSCTSRFKGVAEKKGYSRSAGSSRVRSRTFEGIARAMAHQWGCNL